MISSGVQVMGEASNALSFFGRSGWSQSTTMAITIAAGGLSGGISSTIAGGKFADGAKQGLITSGLNHVAHSTIQRIKYNAFVSKIDESIERAELDPNAAPESEELSYLETFTKRLDVLNELLAKVKKAGWGVQFTTFDKMKRGVQGKPLFINTSADPVDHNLNSDPINFGFSGIGNGRVHPGMIQIYKSAFASNHYLALTIGAGLIYHTSSPSFLMIKINRYEKSNEALRWYNEWGY